MRLGVDLGGTKIEVLALDEAGTERVRRRVPTPASDYHAIVRAIRDLVVLVEREAGATGSVGVGIPGAISPATGLVKNANTVVLIGKPLRDDLSAALARPVRIDNDANCFALSEAVDGAGADGAVVFGAILGTGCGAGIVINRQVVAGRNLIAGEWGHTPLPRMTAEETASAPECYCGRRGCLETFVSGPGLASDHTRATGERIPAPSIVARAEGGDGGARATLARHADRIGRGLAQIVNILDPDVIVLGGGLSNLPDLAATLAGTTRPHVFSDRFDTPIRVARHGDSSGVRGAAWLWPPASVR